MRVPMNYKQRLKMIEYALQEKAPRTYRELKKSSALKKFLQDHDDAMMDCLYGLPDAVDLVRREDPDLEVRDYLGFIRRIYQVIHQQEGTLLADWLEFSDGED